MILNVFYNIAPVKLTLLPQIMKATSFIMLLTFLAGSCDQNTVVSLHGFPKHRCLSSWLFLVAEPNRGPDNCFITFALKPIDV